MTDHLNKIHEVYASCISDEETVYKSCKKEWIVVLKKLPTTRTNEKRSDVVNSKCAKFRANELKVIGIFNKFDCLKTIKTIGNDDYKYDSKKYISKDNPLDKEGTKEDKSESKKAEDTIGDMFNDLLASTGKLLVE